MVWCGLYSRSVRALHGQLRNLLLLLTNDDLEHAQKCFRVEIGFGVKRLAHGWLVHPEFFALVSEALERFKFTTSSGTRVLEAFVSILSRPINLLSQSQILRETDCGRDIQ